MLTTMVGGLAAASPAFAAEVEVNVELPRPDERSQGRSLAGFIRDECGACDPAQEVALRVADTLDELFPFHDFAPHDAGKERQYRLQVTLRNTDPMVQSTTIELRLLDRRTKRDVVLGHLPSMPFAAPGSSSRSKPLLAQTRIVLLNAWSQLMEIVQSIPIVSLARPEQLVTRRPQEPGRPEHMYVDTRLDTADLAPTGGGSVLFQDNLVFMLRWPDDMHAPVHFLMCDPQWIKGPAVRFEDMGRLGRCLDRGLGFEVVGDLPALEAVLYLRGMRR